MASNITHHFVLVHGLGQGAWCWFMLRTLLEYAGHKVSTMDLLASGTNLKHIDEVHSLLEYSQPLLKLMERIPSDEKVILVGHSFGGMSIAYAMDKFPHKIVVGVFLAAFMPDTMNPPSYVMQKFVPEDFFLDSNLTFADEGSGKPKTTLLFGPKFQRYKFYQLSPPEYATLGITLTRIGSIFIEELSTATKLSPEGYGSVDRVYIIAKQDLGLPIAFQRWMIQNNPVKKVMELEGTDHFLMIFKSKKVCRSLVEIANQYA